MQMKRTAAIAAVACLALGGLAACGDEHAGGSHAGKRNGVEKLTAKQILDKATTALRSAPSVREVFTSREADADITTDHADRCKGRVHIKAGHEAGIQADIVGIDDDHYLKGNHTYWKTTFGKDADRLEVKTGGRYVKASDPDQDDPFDYTYEFCGGRSVFTHDGDRLAKGGISTVNGTRCVETTVKGADGTSRIYVATTGKPYPIRMSSSDNGAPVTEDFSGYDRHITVKAPPPDQVIGEDQLW